MEQDKNTDDQIRQILSMKKVAVIGMSKNSSKAAHYVPRYLSENDYDVIPVNPNVDEILGKKCYDSVSEIDDDIDIVVNLTIHHVHAAVIKQCLEAGKHVYSEKPFTMNYDETALHFEGLDNGDLPDQSVANNFGVHVRLLYGCAKQMATLLVW